MDCAHVGEQRARHRLIATARARARARREYALLMLASVVVAVALLGHVVLAGPAAVESSQRYGVTPFEFLGVAFLFACPLLLLGPAAAGARDDVRRHTARLANARQDYDSAFNRMLEAEGAREADSAARASFTGRAEHRG